MSSTSCPVPYTCPDIDGIVDVLKMAVEKLDRLYHDFPNLEQGDTEDTLQDIETSLTDLFNDRKSPLEELRSANETLREWGEGLEEELTEVKQELALVEAALEGVE